MTLSAAGGLSGGASAWPEDLRVEFDSYLEDLAIPGEDVVSGLAEAMRYSLLAGGKRIRPVLALATQRALGRGSEEVLPLAAALEMIHTYSLIHDDLPAMDDDDLRRGRPTLHRVSGEAVAILAGDALYAEAFNLLLTSGVADAARTAAAAGALAAATGVSGMVGGQYLDIGGGADAGPEGLELLHGMKTGRLIESSCNCVLLLAGEEGERADSIRSYAAELGLLFQIVDDILDVTGSDSGLGKPAGSDERQGRRTFVSDFGLDGARRLADERHLRSVSSLVSLGEQATELVAIADHVATRTS
jgi:geranylgeranyl diphosphate synthase type II